MSRYYKIKIEGELKDILTKIKRQRDKFFKESRLLIEEVGAVKGDFFGNFERGMIYAFRFEKEPDLKIWKRWASKEIANAYAPRLSTKAGRELDNRVSNLTKSDYAPLWDHLNWAKDQVVGNRIIFRPGFQHSKNNEYLLLVFDPDVKYKPIEGMESLSWEEYKKLGGEE